MTVFGHKREKGNVVIPACYKYIMQFHSLLQFWFQFYFIAKNKAQASLHLHIPMKIILIPIFIFVILPILYYNIEPNRGVAARDKGH